MSRNVANKAIIVTGASSGIGERIAWHIAKNGGTPIMIARSIKKLTKLKQMMDQSLGIESFTYQADLTNVTELENVIKQILAEHKQIHGLINNAGAGVFDYVETMRLTDMENMFQLNVFALIRGTKFLLPHFLAKQEGHIVNIASQAGKIATPKSAIYASTKHAVLGFTNALRLEMTDKSIHVMAVNLGPVRTNFFDAADPDGTYQKGIERYMLDPDRVAQKIVQHLFMNKREINLPRWMDLGSKLYQLFPKTMELLLRKQFNKK
ncbi:SDR family NAD(P)-dependent oxidoreductase [Virgibacillus ndiopensis]|uniref:SDR family NAD(P)-dependent oxidoreductase n=1 Tax=Virgibacillus ndiopensis TaxID=2004408 RepID=UPI000C08A369|nr:SDR family oxidoreductase [Virgibacillus ndiopensis]